jgi:predicted regulator of Ras-like GTPase activity (Roadblock/LC7/MglB family)
METLEIYKRIHALKEQYGCNGSMLIGDDNKIVCVDMEETTPGPMLAMMCGALFEASDRVFKELKIEPANAVVCIQNNKRTMIKKYKNLLFVCVYDVTKVKPELFEAVDAVLKEIGGE